MHFVRDCQASLYQAYRTKLLRSWDFDRIHISDYFLQQLEYYWLNPEEPLPSIAYKELLVDALQLKKLIGSLKPKQKQNRDLQRELVTFIKSFSPSLYLKRVHQVLLIEFAAHLRLLRYRIPTYLGKILAYADALAKYDSIYLEQIARAAYKLDQKWFPPDILEAVEPYIKALELLNQWPYNKLQYVGRTWLESLPNRPELHFTDCTVTLGDIRAWYALTEPEWYINTLMRVKKLKEQKKSHGEE